jgi:acetyltransferase-like isoleucine patch superfamily enzyme
MRQYLDRYASSLYFNLRRLGYALTPVRLPKKGVNCRIHPTAMFVGIVENIVIGNKVNIEPYAQIYAAHNSQITIGDRCTLSSHSIVKTAGRGATIEIGEHTTLQNFSAIYGAGPVRIGRYVRIASHTSIIPVNKTFTDTERLIHHQAISTIGITIEDDVWIGSGVRILDGVTIGRGSVVAAGAVVNSSFPPMSVIGGVPARLLKRRDLVDNETKAAQAPLDSSNRTI